MNKFLMSLLVAGSAFGLGSQAQANSLDKPGSLLIYPYFDNSRGRSTFITVTNTNSDFNQNGQLLAGTVDVEFVYINGADCLEFNRTRRLTPNDTITVDTNNDNPNDPAGYVYVFAKSPFTGGAIVWNWLEGDSIISSAGNDDDLQANVNPIVYAGIGANGTNADDDGDGIRDLNGIEYAVSADKLHIPRFIADSDSGIIFIGLTGSTFTTVVGFLAYNDNEVAFSGQTTFDCWDYKRLSQISGVFNDNFLENSGDDSLDTGVDNDEVGWIRMEATTAFSNTQQRSNPAFLAVRVDDGKYASLPYGIDENPNGDLVVIGPFFDTN